MFVDNMSLTFDLTTIELSFTSNSILAFCRHFMTLTKCSGMIFVTSTSPPTAAAAIKNVPASILSGITEIFEIEFRDVTPFIVRVFLPIP